jgi:hypothetical protein
MTKIRLIWNDLHERFPRFPGFLRFDFSFGSAGQTDPGPFVPPCGLGLVQVPVPTACSSTDHASGKGIPWSRWLL